VRMGYLYDWLIEKRGEMVRCDTVVDRGSEDR